MALLDGLGLKGGLNVGGLMSGGGFNIGGSFTKVNTPDVMATDANGPLKELYRPGKGAVKPLQYPMDLDKDHYLLITIKNRVMHPDATTNHPATNPDTIGTIALPVPVNLRDETGVEYNNQALGLFGAGGAGLMNGTEAAQDLKTILKEYGLDAGGNILGQGWDFVKELGVGGSLMAGSALYLGSKMGMLAGIGAAAAGAQYAQGFAYNRGKAYNPRLAVLFNSVNFRQFQFAYRFIARNQQESETISEIVKRFKYHMLPSYSEDIVSGSMFSYPDEFYLEFSDTIRPHLFDFKPCVLQNVSVSYNSESGPAFFDDTHAPVIVDLTLQFQEVKLWAKNEPVGAKPDESFPAAKSYLENVARPINKAIGAPGPVQPGLPDGG